MNHVAISGNLTRDPELVTTNSGSTLARCGIAVNQSKKVGDSWEDVTHFVDITVFGRRAELFAEKANKGDFVFVDGRLDFSQWETDGGEKRSKLAVVANEVGGEFQFRKAGASPAKPAAPAPAATQATAADDDIPF